MTFVRNCLKAVGPDHGAGRGVAEAALFGKQLAASKKADRIGSCGTGVR